MSTAVSTSPTQREPALTGQTVVLLGVAALAIHLMTNTALTGATYDIDGSQELLS
jgi:hypothetical protein